MNQIPCFVISLSDSPRREAIAPRLSGLGISFRFQDAVDGQALTDAQSEAVYDEAARRRHFPRSLAPPEIGCSLSHLAVYQRIVEDDLAGALVLEDDAIPKACLPAFLDDIAAIPEAADVVSLYSGMGFVRRAPSFAIAGIPCHRASGNLAGTVGYFIRRNAARMLLSENPKITRPSDWPVDPRRLGFYLTLPFLVGHDHGPSHMETERNTSSESRRGGKRARLPTGTGAANSFRIAMDSIARKHRAWARKTFPGRYIDLSQLPAGAATWSFRYSSEDRAPGA